MKLAEAWFRDGLFDGPVKVWHDNGRVAVRGSCSRNWGGGEWTVSTEDGLQLTRVRFDENQRTFLDGRALPKGFDPDKFLGEGIPGADSALIDRRAKLADSLSCDYLQRALAAFRIK